MKFTRCPDTCVYKACKTQDVEADANELYLELDVSGLSLLDSIGDEDPNNHISHWADTTDLDNYYQAMVIITLLNNQDQYRNLDCENPKTWKAYVSNWLHKCGNVFSKNQVRENIIIEDYMTM